MVYLQASVGGGFHAFEEVLVYGVEGDSERTIDNSAINMDAEVDAQHIIVLKYDFLSTRIGRPVSSNVVQAQSSRETHASLQGISRLNTLVAH